MGAIKLTEQDLWVEKVRTLPVLPQVTLKITERIQEPSATMPEIAAMLRTDAALSSKILRLANSSYYSIPGGVSDVERALNFLGFSTIAQMVLTSSVVGVFSPGNHHHFSISEFWEHSFGVGLRAELAALHLGLPNPKACFAAGLLHDIGKLALLECEPQQLDALHDERSKHASTFIEAEKSLGAIPHTTIGASLAKHWNLPPALIFEIQSHHDAHAPTLTRWANEQSHFTNLKNDQQTKQKNEVNPPAHLVKLCHHFGLTERDLEKIENKFKVEFEKAGAMIHGHS
jgi:putative nucleotidyltransferase with HDIG domain